MSENPNLTAQKKIDMLVDMVKILYDRINLLENKLMMMEHRQSSVERWVLHEPLVIKNPSQSSETLSVTEMLNTVRGMSTADMASFANFADTLLREQ